MFKLKKYYFVLVQLVIVFSILKLGAEDCNQNSFAVVELFTSEGCSDCPPADKNLIELSKIESNKNVFPLSFHVTYWDYIGWKDPFGQPEFTERQEKYSDKLKSGNYTPQAIVNGKIDIIGSKKNQLINSINSELAKKTNVNISLELNRQKNLIEVKYNVSCFISNQILNIALIEKGILSKVTRGENRGKTLEHENVVRSFYSIDLINPKGNKKIEFLGLNQNPQNFEIIAYLQDKNSFFITAANKYKLY